MKTLKSILTILLVLLLTDVYSQKAEVAYIKIQQNYNLLKMDSYVRISYPDGTIKSIELAKAGWRIDDVEEIANTKLIQNEINSLTDLGYEVSSCAYTGDYLCRVTIMTFSRKKEK